MAGYRYIRAVSCPENGEASPEFILKFHDINLTLHRSRLIILN
ncbi:hypothetical protein [Methanosarcina sp.]